MKPFQAEYELNVERLCKRLHIDGDSFSDQSSREVIPKMREIAEKHMDINVWYREGNGEFQTEIPAIDDCERQIICLVYTSQKILDIMEEMSSQGDYLESYILNDLTNDMLFNASNQLNKYLTEKYKKEGKYLTEKYFPGENGISLKLQKNFLNLMKEKEDLELDINSSYMLIPEKSMLYAFGADAKNEEVPWQHDCSKCDRTHCFFREDGEKTGFCPR